MKTKLIIFDMDGVLCDCRDLHYHALNDALEFTMDMKISYEDHLLRFDGLNTRAKLDLLGIKNEDLRDQIFQLKQDETMRLAESISADGRLWKVLNQLRSHDIKLCVASNSIKETTRRILQRLRILEWFDFYLSNEDVLHPKPAPDLYWMAMDKAQIDKKHTLIIEDSQIGIAGATASGARVLCVKDSSEVTYENIIKHCRTN